MHLGGSSLRATSYVVFMNFFVLFIDGFVMSTSWSEHLRRHARGVLVLAPAPVRDWRLGPCTCANATHFMIGFVMPLTSWSRHLRQRAQASWSRHLRYMAYCDHVLTSPIAVQLQYSAPIGGRYCWGVVVHGARCDYFHDYQWPAACGCPGDRRASQPFIDRLDAALLAGGGLNR